MPKADPGST